MTNKTMINRFFEKVEIPQDLKFDKEVGDVIMLDGRYHLITAFGIYDNQMWTEKIYEDGCHLGAGNYEFIEGAATVTDSEIRHSVISAYKKAISENYYKFQTECYSEKVLEEYLLQFEADFNAPNECAGCGFENGHHPECAVEKN